MKTMKEFEKEVQEVTGLSLREIPDRDSLTSISASPVLSYSYSWTHFTGNIEVTEYIHIYKVDGKWLRSFSNRYNGMATGRRMS